jgi:hypothetical protein
MDMMYSPFGFGCEYHSTILLLSKIVQNQETPAIHASATTLSNSSVSVRLVIILCGKSCCYANCSNWKYQRKFQVVHEFAAFAFWNAF